MAGSKKEEDKKYNENWGGVRSGAGRKKISESGRIAVQISPQQDELDEITKAAEKEGLNRTRFVIKCVKFYLENHK